MAINYSYGNPGNTLNLAMEQLRNYYRDIKSPELIQVEDAYTRDMLGKSGQMGLIKALDSAGKQSQLGSNRNRLTMNAISDIMGKTPETYANLIAGQRGRLAEGLANYTGAASGIGGMMHDLGMGESEFNERLKQYAQEMAMVPERRRREQNIMGAEQSAEEALLRLKHELNQTSWWRRLLGGIAGGAGAIFAPMTGGASLGAGMAINRAVS